MNTNKTIDTKVGLVIIFIAVFLFFGLIVFHFQSFDQLEKKLGVNINSVINKTNQPKETTENVILKEKVSKFTDVQDFKDYLDKSNSVSNQNFFGTLSSSGLGGMQIARESAPSSNFAAMDKSLANMAETQVQTPERFSQTNVQVLGVDEPDIIKNNNKTIFYSTEPRYFPLMEKGMGVASDIAPSPISRSCNGPKCFPPPYPVQEPKGETKIINAFPPKDLKLDGKIDKQGDLLLSGNILVVFSQNKIYGYDVSQSDDPQQKWSIELKDNNEIVDKRLSDGKIYLVTKTAINIAQPCPIELFANNGTSYSVKCTDIYHPEASVQVDGTYNLLKINAISGDVDNSLSFVGSLGSNTVYMSQDAMYLAYNYPGDYTKYFSDFLNENSDLLPQAVTDKIIKLISYDISGSSKYNELQNILNNYKISLSNDDRMRLENEISNRMDKYSKQHAKELEYTGIEKINLSSVQITGSGKINGHLLNQFSMDEYQGNLRVAVSYGNQFGFVPGMSSENNTSDVLILDGQLNRVGSVENLGKGERIYSVRFIDEKGYVVTFRQIDPFFVLDLANPKNPQLKGELKIPGFSTYLHPISENVILGIGQEDGRVKLTLFDVSNPENPQELNTYKLEEYWTEAANNHHAFTIDQKHQIFFLPGGSGGYVFSYANNELKLAKAISGNNVKRAIYINDNLYVIGENKIVVLDENNWGNVGELELN